MLNKLLVVAVCGGCAFLGGIVSELFSHSPQALSAQNPPLPPAPVATDPDKATVVALSEKFQAVVRQVGPAVVAVDAVKPPSAPATAGTRAKPEEESGSGVLVKFAGVTGTVVVTNNHVVGAASPDKVFVTLSDGRILRPVRVLADPESDISLLQIDTDDLPTVPLADSERVKRGQWVLAFGSPFGLNQTVTHGIVSATDRGQISLGSTIRIKEFLQTDAAINPGSSGGPLVNLDGQVVGINTAIASKSGSSSGVSFSIPANLIKRIALQLFEKGTVTRGYLGVQLASTLEPAEALRLGLNKVSGALVEIVHPGTPAATAGLRQGDVLLRLEDVELRDENHLINLVSALPPNQKVRLTVWRNRQSQQVEVLIGDWTNSRSRAYRP
jgi:S1-C subfamily serine protease